MRSLSLLAKAFLLLACLIWPAVYNGQPFFFDDTTSYIRGFDAGVEKATGHQTSWSAPSAQATPDAGTSATDRSIAGSLSSISDKTILSGRSIYYGALLYIGHIAGGFWLTILIQGGILLLVFLLTFRALHEPVWPGLGWVTAIVGLVTPAGFFVSFLMPDLFAGVTILATAVLLLLSSNLTAWEASLWLLILLAALTFHTSHVAIASIMAAVWLIWTLRRGEWSSARPVIPVAGAIALAMMAQAAFGLAVTRLVGRPPISPPFLTARLVADGPGRRYLQQTCPRSGFTACASVDRLPKSADQFLWSTDPATGVFAVSTPEARRALSDEQFRFVVAVAAFEPLGVLRAALANGVRQLGLMRLPEFAYDSESKATYEIKLPAEHLQRMKQTAAYRGSMPTRVFGAASYASCIFGLLYLAMSWSSRRIRMNSRVASLAAFSLAGVLINAVVTGALSGPHDRYGARTIWLVTFFAVLSHLNQQRSLSEIHSGQHRPEAVV